MAINTESYHDLVKQLDEKKITLVAVSKTKPVADIQALYDLGHRDFGENYVQELVEKSRQLPTDIRWHFIGHLQRNKVKLIVPFVHLVHGVDSFKLLEEINSQSLKINKTTDCLLQVHIATEESKFGFDETELKQLLESIPRLQQLNKLNNVRISGLMGMASFTDNEAQVRKEFQLLKRLFDETRTFQHEFSVLSMGMSADYKWAVEEGSNMVRIGSLIFGNR